MENHLELNRLNPAPLKRKAKIIRQKTKALKYSYVVTKEEAEYFVEISNCGNLDDMVSLQTSMIEIEGVSIDVEYILTVIHDAYELILLHSIISYMQ